MNITVNHSDIYGPKDAVHPQTLPADTHDTKTHEEAEEKGGSMNRVETLISQVRSCDHYVLNQITCMRVEYPVLYGPGDFICAIVVKHDGCMAAEAHRLLLSGDSTYVALAY
jgi:hypothetical protein